MQRIRPRALLDWVTRPSQCIDKPVQCVPPFGPQPSSKVPYAARGLRALLQTSTAYDSCVISTAVAVLKQPSPSNVWASAAVIEPDFECISSDSHGYALPEPQAVKEQAAVTAISGASGANVRLLASRFEASKARSHALGSSTAAQAQAPSDADATVLVTVAQELEKAPSVRKLLQTWESLSNTQPCSLSRTSSSASACPSTSSSQASCTSPPKPGLRPAAAAALPHNQPAPAAAAAAADQVSTASPPLQQQQQGQAAQPATVAAAAERRVAPKSLSAAVSLMVCSAVGLCMLTA